VTAPSQYRRAFVAAPVFVAALVAAFILLGHGGGAAPAAAAETGPCTAPVTNKVACENTKPGVPPEEWEIEGPGDEDIQGFSTQQSVNIGQTVNFKIKTNARAYHINILRLGWYEGDGARMIASNVQPSATLPQTQPACKWTEATGLIDCGNWGISASWAVPTSAVSGLYIAQLVRNDNGDKSDIFFVVREDESHAPIVLKTSDATWEAYNAWGGNSLYSCEGDLCPPSPPGKREPEGYKAAFSVSYNRPFDGTIQTDFGQSDPFYAEYQMIRFLERNGYNMTYIAQPDVQEHGQLLLNHKLFISSGHDEYWSGQERANVEAAREAKVNLAFFSGNEMFWKTRWGPSTAGEEIPNRTLTTYKETHFNEQVDPQEPSTATSSWRDPRFKSGGAGKPENSLTGQYFEVNSGTSDIKVPGTFAKDRFWKNTAVANLSPTQTLTLSPGTGTLGYEWDVDADNGFRPPGRISLSSTTVNGVQTFTDYGTQVEEPNVATHSLSLYRAPSGALVFGAGTVQWSWGLDNTNAWGDAATDPSENPPDPTMQQATVNILAEMGAQPGTLMSGLVPATESTDHTPPTAKVTSPTAGQSFKNGEVVTVKGTAEDFGGGVVAAVEVSTDGGATWHPATGTTAWTYAWNVEGDKTAKVEARAIDDSANIGVGSAPITVNVSCPCSLLGGLTPEHSDAGDTFSTELGVKFQSEVSGTISGIRYFKSTANTGTHTGTLWTVEGTKLAEATFTGETASGWQTVKFATPVPIKANTTYLASYFAPKGHYADNAWQLNDPPAVGSNILEQPPLRILPDTEGGNGVFQYTSEPTFPNGTFHADNYWVDVLFAPAEPPQQVTNVHATAGIGEATVTWTAPTSGAPVTSFKITPFISGVAQTPVTAEATATSKSLTGLTGGKSYTFVVTALNEAGAGPDSAASNAVTPSSAVAPGAPTGAKATAGPLSAFLEWTAPTSTGGSPITGYRITPIVAGKAGTPINTGTIATAGTVTGLTAGTTYTFTVAATNAIGTGTASAQSNSVLVNATSVPTAPTGLTAAPKSSGAVLNWTAPTSNGGSAITGYKVTPFIGATPQTPVTVAGTATTATLAGLSDGTAYTFRVAAINAIGTSAESSPSAVITPYDSIFDLTTPGTVDSGDSGSVELGVKFQSEVGGTIEGVRFYKAATNIGTHIGSLWTTSGELLAEATFTNETASGWQQVKFASPVTIKANTTYVASYLAPLGHYSVNGPTLATAIINPPLLAEASTGAGNGVYEYGTGVHFPKESYNASNYWVDVLFMPEAVPVAPGPPTSVTATAGLGSATISWHAPTTGAAPTSYIVTPYEGATALTATTVSGSPPTTSTTISGLTSGTSYTFKVQAVNAVGPGTVSAASNAVVPTGGPPNAPTAVTASPRNGAAAVSWTAPGSNGQAITGYKVTPYIGTTAQATTSTSGTGTTATISSLTNGTSYTFVVQAVNAGGTSAGSTASSAVVPRYTLFEQGTPATVDVNDPGPVVLGVKFSSTIAGHVAGIRFYKAAANTGSHPVGLWTSSGELLAQTTGTGETASGWQEVKFAAPVAILANTTYVAAYLSPVGHYSATGNGFATATTSSPLTAPANGTSPNGLYAYGSSLVFPTNTYNATNYWVDVMFTP
jgi:hypothetical protein